MTSQPAIHKLEDRYYSGIDLTQQGKKLFKSMLARITTYLFFISLFPLLVLSEQRKQAFHFPFLFLSQSCCWAGVFFPWRKAGEQKGKGSGALINREGELSVRENSLCERKTETLCKLEWRIGR